MAYLGKYIRQILSRQEPVVLPGFGSLVISQGKGGRGEGGTIEPPGPVVRFDATHPKGDGKLSAEYASGEQIDPEEARQQVLELVDAIKFKLDKGEKYTLELVGEFSRDDDNKVHFRKDPNWVIDPELFGLPELDLLELDAEEEAEPTINPRIGETERVSQEEEKPKPVEQAAKQTKPVRSVQRKPVNKWKIIWIVVGSLIIVLVLILMIPGGNGIEFGKDGLVISDDSTEQTTIQGSRQTDPGNTDEDSMPRAGEQTSPVHEGNEATPQQAPVINENRYFIIAGSFQNVANAGELMESLRDAGFPSEVIVTENRLYRVSIQSYPTKQEAVRDLQRVRDASGMKSAWVLTR